MYLCYSMICGLEKDSLIKSAIIILIGLIISFSVISCDDDSNQLGEKKNIFPSRVILNAKVTSKDSAILVFSLDAPIIQEYGFLESPQIIAPKGVKIIFFEEGKQEPTTLTADYARMIQKEQWYEAKGNVVLINADKDTLKTYRLFWNEKQRKIFTNDTVRIIRSDGITTNTAAGGIEASSDFKNYKLLENSGVLPAEEIEK